MNTVCVNCRKQRAASAMTRDGVCFYCDSSGIADPVWFGETLVVDDADCEEVMSSIEALSDALREASQ